MSRGNDDKSVGTRLRAVRKAQGCSQQEFSKLLDISLSAYKNYERGERPITKDLILSLKDTYGIELIWLLTGEKSQIAKRGKEEGSALFGDDDKWIKDDLIEFGKRVKRLRKEKGLSLENLGAKTEMSERLLQQIENGERWPSQYRCMKLAFVLTGEENEDSLLHGLEFALVPPTIRINHFGSLIGLTFNKGGNAHVSFNFGDVMKIINALVDYESSRPNPDPRMSEIKEHFAQNYWLPDEEENEDDARSELGFIANVPMGVHGVQIEPVWPSSPPITEEEMKKFRRDFYLQEGDKATQGNEKDS